MSDSENWDDDFNFDGPLAKTTGTKPPTTSTPALPLPPPQPQQQQQQTTNTCTTATGSGTSEPIMEDNPPKSSNSTTISQNTSNTTTTSTMAEHQQEPHTPAKSIDLLRTPITESPITPSTTPSHHHRSVHRHRHGDKSTSSTHHRHHPTTPAPSSSSKHNRKTPGTSAPSTPLSHTQQPSPSMSMSSLRRRPSISAASSFTLIAAHNAHQIESLERDAEMGQEATSTAPPLTIKMNTPMEEADFGDFEEDLVLPENLASSSSWGHHARRCSVIALQPPTIAQTLTDEIEAANEIANSTSTHTASHLLRTENTTHNAIHSTSTTNSSASKGAPLPKLDPSQKVPPTRHTSPSPTPVAKLPASLFVTPSHASALRIASQPARPNMAQTPESPSTKSIPDDDELSGLSFGDDDIGSGPKMIRGIAADPTNIECDWENDFDLGNFGGGTASSGGAPKPLVLAKQHKDLAVPTVTLDTEHHYQELKHLFSAISSLDMDIGIWNKVPLLDPMFETDVEFFDEALSAKAKEISEAFKAGIENLDQGSPADAMSFLKKSLQLYQEITSSFGDPDFEAQLLIFMSQTAKCMSDIFLQQDLLTKASKLLPETPANPRQVQLHTTICYEVALIEASRHAPTALPHIITYLHWVLYCKPSKPTKTAKAVDNLKWHDLARACATAGNTLLIISGKAASEGGLNSKQARHLAKKYLKKAGKIASVIGDTELISIAEKRDLGSTTTVVTSKHSSDSVSELSSNKDDETDLDWDTEMGITDSRVNLAQTLRGSVTVTAPDYTIPTRCKLLENTINQKYEEIRYPAPLWLYSLKTAKGHEFFHEEEVGQWLGTLVSKHLKVNIVPVLPKDQIGHGKPIAKNYDLFVASLAGQEEKYSAKWTQRILSWLFLLKAQRHLEEMWEASLAFFKDIKQAKSSTNTAPVAADTSVDTSSDGEGSTESSDSDDRIKDEQPSPSFFLAIEVLYLNAALWKVERQPQWMIMLDAARSLLPLASLFVDIIEQEAYAHFIMKNGFEVQYWEKAGFTPAPISSICSIYKQLSPRAVQKKNPFSPLILGMCVADIVLCSSFRSPLTAKFMDNKNQQRPQCLPPFEFGADGELEVDICCGCVDLSQHQKRIQLLEDFYKQLSLSWHKAKLCFTLALESDSIAERLLFETLFILDTAPQPVIGNALIMSSFSLLVLERFGDVLIHNYKYQYGILCHESAIVITRLLHKSSYVHVNTHMAEVAQKQDDPDRTIGAYSNILATYDNKKPNEEVYVRNILAGLYLECGNFPQAEEFLVSALAIISKKSKNIIDPMFWKLKQKLAQVYLESYHFERGIELLERLQAMSIPKDERTSVAMMLAEAYAKKGWVQELNNALTYIATSDASLTKATVGAQRTKQVHTMSLCARCYLASGQYQAALFCINASISTCQETQLSLLGKLFYLRGKILKTACFAHQTFPTPVVTIPPEFAKVFPAGPPPSPEMTFSSPGDILQACIESFKKAEQFFRAVVDDIRRAKTMNKMAESMLEYCFPPVALLHIPLDSVCHMPLLNRRTSTDDSSREEFVINITKDIESPATSALDICADTFHVLLIMSCYMSLVELRYLQSEKDAAILFWKECRDLFFCLFFDGPLCMVKGGPPHFLGKLFTLLKRMVRFLFCQEKDFINKNLAVVDAYILLQIDLEQAQKRAVEESPDPAPNPTSNSATPPSSDESRVNGTKHAPRASIVGMFDGSEHPEKAPVEQPPSTQPEPPVCKEPVSAASIKPNPSPGRMASSSSFSAAALLDDTMFNIHHEAAAEQSWCLVTKLKTNFHKYSSGKIAQQELVTRNRDILKTIIKVVNAARSQFRRVNPHSRVVVNTCSACASPSSPSAIVATGSASGSASPLRASFCVSPGMGTSMSRLQTQDKEAVDLGYRVEDLVLRRPQEFQSLAILLQLDRFILYYTPHTGKVHIDQLGACEHEKSSLVASGPLHIKVSLMLTNQTTPQFALFTVLPESTISSLLEMLCKLFNEGQFQERKKKGGFFTTLGKATIHSPKYTECSEQFHSELAKLLNNLSSGVTAKKILTPGYLSLAKALSSASSIYTTKKIQPILLPHTSAIHKLFSTPELRFNSDSEPLELFLCGKATAFENADTTTGHLISLSPSLMTYLQDLVLFNSIPKAQEITPEDTKLGQEVATELHSVFQSVAASSEPLSSSCSIASTSTTFTGTLTLLMSTTGLSNPQPVAKQKGFPSFFSKSEPTAFRKVPEFPVVLICSKSLQIIPWELFVGNVVVRYFSVYDFVLRIQNSEYPVQQFEPSYFSMFNQQPDKLLMQTEDERREFLLRQVFFQLFFSPKMAPLSRVHSSCTPFHSPLVENGKRLGSIKKRYKFCSFLDGASINTKPRDLLQFVDKLVVGCNTFPVLIMSWSDLLGCSTCLMHLLRRRPICSVLFVPCTKQRSIMLRLTKAHDIYFKTALSSPGHPLRDRYQFLLSLITQVTAETKIPIAIFNPPLSLSPTPTTSLPPLSPPGSKPNSLLATVSTTGSNSTAPTPPPQMSTPSPSPGLVSPTPSPRNAASEAPVLATETTLTVDTTDHRN
ncbi:hypothetical protein Pelo_14352 [Pelomyxa schiedti]|nr:hypothetical protein Pelo_14352 [Pelomyxa schiedti]